MKNREFPMTLNQLEYFCTVCRYHSITRAAEELFISQPTISLALKELEKEFQLQLFNHTRNKISLTSDGEQFYLRAQDLLTQTQSLYTDFSLLGQTVRPIKIGIPPMISTVFFPRMIDSFHEISDTPIQLYEFGSVRALSMVKSGELDLAIVNLDFYDKDNFNYHVLMEDKTIYCVSRSHPYAKETAVTIDMLKDEAVIFLNTDSVQNQTINLRYRKEGLTPNVILYSSQLYTTLNFIRGGNCGAFLYSTLAANPRDFVQIPVYPEITTQFGAVWKKDSLQGTTQEFIDFVKQYDITSYV